MNTSRFIRVGGLLGLLSLIGPAAFAQTETAAPAAALAPAAAPAPAQSGTSGTFTPTVQTPTETKTTGDKTVTKMKPATPVDTKGPKLPKPMKSNKAKARTVDAKTPSPEKMDK